MEKTWKPAGEYQTKNFEPNVSYQHISTLDQILASQEAVIAIDSNEDAEYSSFEPPKDQPSEITVEREAPPNR